MSGFFSDIEAKGSSKRISELPSCSSCGLFKKANNPKAKPVGLGKKGILIIGSSVSSIEDRDRDYFSGKPTQLLSKILKRHDIDLHRDCIRTNAISCYKVGDLGDDVNLYINSCRPLVMNLIKEFKPKLILLLGTNPIYSFLAHRVSKVGGMDKWRGFAIPDRDYNCWVVPTFGPSKILHNEDKPAYLTIFKQDIRKAVSLLNKDLPKFWDDEKCINILKGKELYNYLRRLAKSELCEIAFDFETTGLKPQRNGHRIVTCAIAEEEDHCVAFTLPEDKRTLAQLCKVLESPAIRKVAANIKYEDTWAKEILGVTVKNWVWDTMQAAHIIDNRQGITSLDFQTYINFGVVDYSSHMKKHLSGDLKGVNGCNEFNNIDGAFIDDLLLYNAKDSLYELRLANIQRRILK